MKMGKDGRSTVGDSWIKGMKGIVVLRLGINMDKKDRQDKNYVEANGRLSGLRVLHLVRSLNVGGLEKVVVDLTRGLSERGVENYLGCLVERGGWCDKADVVDVWCGDLGKGKSVVSLFFELCRYVKKNNINVIHSHNSHPHKYGAFVSLITGVPLVHTKHGRNWPDNPKWVWFSRQLSRLSKVIVPVSKEIEKIVVDVEKVPSRKVVTILNGVDVSGRTIAGRRERGGFVIGSVGRFSSEKQYPFLVRAFGRFVNTVETRHALSVRLILVGDGGERRNIENEIKRCGVEDFVLLPGMCNDVQRRLNELDVFCLSSDQEGTSITLLEAGALGLPAVVTDVGGNAEIVKDGVTGIVVPFGDEKRMADAFYELYEKASIKEIGEAARARIEKYYSLNVMVDKYRDIYLSISE